MDFRNQLDIQNVIVRFLLPALGCVVAAMATVYMMQEVNPLAAGCICASLVFLVMAAVSPQVGLTILLLLCAYSDLLKRLLVFLGDLSFEQVSYVLAGAPLVVAGLSLAMVTRCAFHRTQFLFRDVLMFTGIAVAAALNFLLSMRIGVPILDASKDALNNTLYLVLTPVMMKLIESPEQIGSFIRQGRLIFIPVAVYGIYQSIFGLADFEVEYLRSGLTMIIKELFDVRPRPFSTLNSAHALGTIAAAWAVLSLYPLLVRREREVPPLGERMLSLGLFVLYIAASLVSLARTALVVWIVALFAFWCFRSRLRTKVFYLSAVGGFLTLIAAAPFFLQHISEWDPANNVQSDVVGQAVRIQTYVERLRGFENLTRSTDMYSFFGLPQDMKMTETTWNHDPISSLLVDFGLTGLLAAGAVVIFGLRFIHRRLLAAPSGIQRDTAVLLTAVNVGWLTSHLLFNSVIGTFPCNTFLWLFNGMIGWLLIEAPLQKPAELSSPEVDEVRLGLPASGGPRGRDFAGAHRS